MYQFTILFAVIGSCLTLQPYQYFNDHVILSTAGHENSIMHVALEKEVDLLFSSNISILNYFYKVYIKNQRGTIWSDIYDQKGNKLSSQEKSIHYTSNDIILNVYWDNEKMNIHVNDMQIFSYMPEDDDKLSKINYVALKPHHAISINYKDTFLYFVKVEKICPDKNAVLNCDLDINKAHSIVNMSGLIPLMSADLYKSTSPYHTSDNYSIELYVDSEYRDPYYRDFNKSTAAIPNPYLTIYKNGLQQLKSTAHFLQNKVINLRIDFKSSFININEQESDSGDYRYHLFWRENEQLFHFESLDRIVLQVEKPHSSNHMSMNKCNIECLENASFLDRLLGLFSRSNRLRTFCYKKYCHDRVIYQ